MKTYTTQEVIDMASELRDVEGFSRMQIQAFLDTLRVMGYWQASLTDAERVFDLVVG